VLWQPLEVLIICGAALGAFIISNPKSVLIGTGKHFGRVLKGSPYSKANYLELLTVLYSIFKLAKSKGALALEAHIENPEQSSIFSNHPGFMKNHEAVEFLCDTLRLVTMGTENPHELENMMEEDIETRKHEAEHIAHAVTAVGDGLPAFGIVAAVLGVVNTMGSVGQPPAVLGAMIGSALVGTFLGILLAYAFAEPLAGLLEQKVDEAGKELQCIKTTLLASMQGYAPQVAVEFGRKVLYSTERPGFAELEAHVKGKK
jgi:chemotaxis protein MotA